MADEVNAPEQPKAEPKKEETREERMKRLDISDVPFHTYETEQIQKQREREKK